MNIQIGVTWRVSKHVDMRNDIKFEYMNIEFLKLQCIGKSVMENHNYLPEKKTQPKREIKMRKYGNYMLANENFS